MTRPTDSDLQRMGILCVETMLPPSPSMIAAGATALKKAVKKNAPECVLIEQVFAAMVLEGMEDLERLGVAVVRDPAPLAKHSIIPYSYKGHNGVGSKPVCFCTQCKEYRKSCVGDGFGATVQVENAPALVAASAGLLSHAASERVLERSDPQVSKKEPQLGHTEEEEEEWDRISSIGAAAEESEDTVRSGTGATVHPIPPGLQDSNTGHIDDNYTKETVQ